MSTLWRQWKIRYFVKLLSAVWECYSRIMAWVLVHICSEYFGQIRADINSVFRGRSFILGWPRLLICSWGFLVWAHGKFSIVTRLQFSSGKWSCQRNTKWSHTISCSWPEWKWLLSLSPRVFCHPSAGWRCGGRVIVEFRLSFLGNLLLDEGKPGLGTEVRGCSCWSKLMPGVLCGHLFGLVHMFSSLLKMGGSRLLMYCQVAGLWLCQLSAMEANLQLAIVSDVFSHTLWESGGGKQEDFLINKIAAYCFVASVLKHIFPLISFEPFFLFLPSS